MNTKHILLLCTLFLSACQVTVLNGQDPNQLQAQNLVSQPTNTGQSNPYYAYYPPVNSNSACESACQSHQANLDLNHCIDTLCQNVLSYYPGSYYPSNTSYYPYFPNGYIPAPADNPYYPYYPAPAMNPYYPYFPYYPDFPPSDGHTTYYPYYPDATNFWQSYYPYYPGSYYPERSGE